MFTAEYPQQPRCGSNLSASTEEEIKRRLLSMHPMGHYSVLKKTDFSWHATTQMDLGDMRLSQQARHRNNRTILLKWAVSGVIKLTETESRTG